MASPNLDISGLWEGSSWYTWKCQKLWFSPCFSAEIP